MPPPSAPVEPPSSLDFFPTPPWATRALLRRVLGAGDGSLRKLAAWEPACGEGHMATVLWEDFGHVHASDVHDYGGNAICDFTGGPLLQPPGYSGVPFDPHWIITNPPFKFAAEFALTALDIARTGVALLVRAQFLEGQERFETLFSVRPPSMVCQFAERVPMHKGRWVVNGKSATSYCWVIWSTVTPAIATQFLWIPPCRAELTRADDFARFGGCSQVSAELLTAINEYERSAA